MSINIWIQLQYIITPYNQLDHNNVTVNLKVITCIL